MPKRSSSDAKDKKNTKKQKEESNSNKETRSSRKKDKEPEEIIEDEDTTKEKVKSTIFILQNELIELADLIRNSKHIVFHVGAGISTAASIPDFRGPKGVWTLQEKGKDEKEIDYGVEFEDALPTLSHMSLVALTGSNEEGKPGIVKYIVSQNVDGLFLRTLISQLSELHGNVYLEVCKKCKTQYLRDFDAAADGNNHHYTGRLCEREGCGGKLVDSIINFGEDLPEQDVQRAIAHSKKADLSIVVGSSLTVTPACEFPEMTVKKGGKLVIINLMPTPYDKDCTLRLFAKSDGVFRTLMEELNIAIPSFTWNMKVWVGHNSEKVKGGKHSWQLFVAGDCGFATRFIQKAQVKELHTADSKQPSKKTKKAKANKTNNNNDDGWELMDGEGEGIFAYHIQTDSAEPMTIAIRLHFAARLNIDPQEIKYELVTKAKPKNKAFEFQKNIELHLRDIAYK